MPPAAAYSFYPTNRRCPSCGQKLVTATPVSREFLKGLLQRMGVTCYCVRCNTRYRATSRLPFAWISWLGPPGNWAWWKTTTLEVTLRSEKPTDRL